MQTKRLGKRILRLVLYFYGACLACFLLQEFYISVLTGPLENWLYFDILPVIGTVVGFFIHVAIMLVYIRGVSLDDINERKYSPSLFRGEFIFSFLFIYAPLFISLLPQLEKVKGIFYFIYAPFLAFGDMLNEMLLLAAMPFFVFEIIVIMAAYSFFGHMYIKAYEREHGESCVYYVE